MNPLHTWGLPLCIQLAHLCFLSPTDSPFQLVALYIQSYALLTCLVQFAEAELAVLVTCLTWQMVGMAPTIFL